MANTRSLSGTQFPLQLYCICSAILSLFLSHTHTLYTSLFRFCFLADAALCDLYCIGVADDAIYTHTQTLRSRLGSSNKATLKLVSSWEQLMRDE